MSSTLAHNAQKLTKINEIVQICYTSDNCNDTLIRDFLSLYIKKNHAIIKLIDT